MLSVMAADPLAGAIASRASASRELGRDFKACASLEATRGLRSIAV